jgi:anti-sigma regulatory factor (Ser/Thr protein kinase)
MEMSPHTPLQVVDQSHVPVTRQQVRLAAERLGFDETDAHRVGLVATELASNLVKHTVTGGQILLRAIGGARPEIELIAIDRGPGIQDLTRSLVDGHSTAGSAGTGLGAVRRLAGDFDIYSQPQKGTVVWARIRRDRDPAPPATRFFVGGVSVAMPGETVCGDSWTADIDRGRVVVLVADGLGHGPHAAEAASAATRAGSTRGDETPAATLSAMHHAARHTRGAAGMVAALDLGTSVVTIAGIGNVVAAIVGNGTVRQAVSHGGILGAEARQFREYRYPWSAGAMLVVHSDGLISHWSVDLYPGLRARHPALIAALLYRDFQRGRDDVTVVVGREAA